MSRRVTVSLALARSAVVAPLLDGEVEPEGIELIPTVASPGDLFWRQLHHQEFDASEFSLASLIILAARPDAARGDQAWTAIPVFPSRGFFHARILVRRDAGIGGPGDLAGRRVGVPEYQQTAALWTRGVLQHEFGVSPGDMEWVMGRTPGQSHALATGFRPPDGVRFSHVPDGETLGSLVASGALDALIAYRTRHAGLGLGQVTVGQVTGDQATSDQATSDQATSDQATGGASQRHGIVGTEVADLGPGGAVRLLFADPAAEGLRYFRATGIFPVSHTVAVRAALAQRHPWLPRNLYEAFCRARDLAYRRLRAQLEPYAALGAVDTGAFERAHRAAPYGIQGNAETLAAVTSYAHEQGLTPARIPPDELFCSTVRA
jgi:4,5-dihydroxyphthalate decarboxylase